ncbi:transcription factor FAMA-like isoform X1 [Silene latifolia]|uniref:transcription factor FAMA-like isoform X1 n=1 Tax=Silene latifolia TaxID=37657 RepID=UPI003D787F26
MLFIGYSVCPLLGVQEVPETAARTLATNFNCSSQNNPVFHHARHSESYDQEQKWQQQQQQLMFETSDVIMTSEMAAVDRTLSFADVMQFADFGPKLALHNSQHDYPQNHNHNQNVSTEIVNRDENSTGVDPVYFLKFPVLSNNINAAATNNFDTAFNAGFSFNQQEEDGDYDNPVQLEFLGNDTNNTTTNNNNNTDENNGIEISGGDKNVELGGGGKSGSSSKRKRPRTIKTTEEVESQRMTHIAVERNRRKQMNEHLRVLRSLMPSSYVQRGDQASIIGGAIEFVRELEQLLQCLESQKRRRLYGDQPPGPPRPPGGEATSPSAMGLVQQPQQIPLGFPPDDELNLGSGVAPMDPTGGLMLQEESAESKSCIADVEVKVLGFDALIKILSRRRPGQLLRAIAALEDLRLTILHTNITTIEQTVLYSFNVKVGSEASFTAEDIANSVQQIFTFIHANTDII